MKKIFKIFDDNYEKLKKLQKPVKIPYQIRIDPAMLKDIQGIAEDNDTSVNHEIRQAIKERINKEKLINNTNN